jgi:hypothetical protein
MSKLKKIILQFSIENHGNIDDFDNLIDIEDKLDSALQRNNTGYVDGHDMGSGQMNIFIFVNTWKHGLWFMAQYLKNQPWSKDATVAKVMPDDTYEVIWPKNFSGEFNIT